MFDDMAVVVFASSCASLIDGVPLDVSKSLRDLAGVVVLDAVFDLDLFFKVDSFGGIRFLAERGPRIASPWLLRLKIGRAHV